MWNADQNRDLTRYGMDQNFYNAQRGLDYQGIQLGANLTQQGLQAPWIPIQNAGNTYGNFTGYGTSSGDNGTNWQQILGGVLGGAQFGRNMNWW